MIFMKELMTMGKEKKVLLNLWMEASMLEVFKMKNFMEKENLHMEMDLYMKVLNNIYLLILTNV